YLEASREYIHLRKDLIFLRGPRCEHEVFVISEIQLLKWHACGTAVALTVMLSVDPSAIGLCFH
ncbi:hypothetical protein COCC4DRAFT_34050, partial [Bipolaris maydis ATCC 48331]